MTLLVPICIHARKAGRRAAQHQPWGRASARSRSRWLVSGGRAITQFSQCSMEPTRPVLPHGGDSPTLGHGHICDTEPKRTPKSRPGLPNAQDGEAVI